MKIELPIPQKTYKTRNGYIKFIKNYFELRGFHTRPARYDNGGNCIYCGESGRCPGIHGIRFDYCLGSSDEF